MDTALIIFAYSRPSHLKRVLIALQDYKIKNKIYLLIDGPKNKKDQINQSTIRFMAKASKMKNLKIIQNKKNLGLAESIHRGVDFVSNKHDSLIILEDDIIPYKNFFKFFNHNLKRFKNNQKISAICGFQYEKFISNKVLFSMNLKNFIPWGWATWSNKWKEYMLFKKNIKKINNRLTPKYMRAYLNKKYISSKKKKIWTLMYIYFNFYHSRSFIFPSYSLIKNIGFDGTGENTIFSDYFTNYKEAKIKKISNNFYIDNKNYIKRQNKLYEKYVNILYP